MTHLFWISSLALQQIHHVVSWRNWEGKLHLLEWGSCWCSSPAPPWLQAHRAAPLAGPAEPAQLQRQTPSPASPVWGLTAPCSSPPSSLLTSLHPSHCQQQQAQEHKLHREQLMELLLLCKAGNVGRRALSCTAGQLWAQAAPITWAMGRQTQTTASYQWRCETKAALWIKALLSGKACQVTWNSSPSCQLPFCTHLKGNCSHSCWHNVIYVWARLHQHSLFWRSYLSPTF